MEKATCGPWAAPRELRVCTAVPCHQQLSLPFRVLGGGGGERPPTFVPARAVTHPGFSVTNSLSRLLSLTSISMPNILKFQRHLEAAEESLGAGAGPVSPCRGVTGAGSPSCARGCFLCPPFRPTEGGYILSVLRVPWSRKGSLTFAT